MATLSLKATEKGHLYPVITDLRIIAGKSNVTVDNKIKSMFYNSNMNMLKHIVANALNSFGKSMINPILPEFTRRYFTD